MDHSHPPTASKEGKWRTLSISERAMFQEDTGARFVIGPPVCQVHYDGHQFATPPQPSPAVLRNNNHGVHQQTQPPPPPPPSHPAQRAAPEVCRSSSVESEEWLMAIERAFYKIAGEDKKINYEEFKKAIDVKQEFFAQRYFQYFDMDGSGHIEPQEFIQSLRQIAGQTDIEKLGFLFKIFDANNDGVITPTELQVVLKACVAESSLRMSDEQLNLLVDSLMRAADKDQNGTITFEELKEQFQKYPALVENLAISPSNWLSVHKVHKSKKTAWTRFSNLKAHALNVVRNKKPLVAVMVLHILVTAACFGGAAYTYRASNGWVIVARCCGMALNYHGAVLALSMARKTLTYVRNTRVGPYLPVDDHIDIHKCLGVWTAVLSLTHTVAHLANIGVVTSMANAQLAFWEYLITTRAGVGWLYGSAYLTGDILTLVLTVIVCCSLPVVRSSGMFELFYWSHLMYMVFWLVLLLHGPNFWAWFLLPGLLLVGERVHDVVFYCIQKQAEAYHIEEVNLLPNKVTHLVISRPANFLFRAGDYVFLKIPSISRWEWHPFSISSAPEQEGVLWLHIRSLGNWTKRLYEFYESGKYEETRILTDEEGMVNRVAALVKRRSTQPNPLKSTPKVSHSITDKRKVYLTGPFGSAAVRIGDTNHAVLIAAGIGVTPFASVLQSLLTQHRRGTRVAPSTDAPSQPHQPRYHDSFKLNKIDFIWVNRQADDFEWFITLLTQLEMEEARQNAFDRFLDLHLYMTSAKTASDLKGIGLQMALELVHQEAQQDMITGLRTRTKAGRPNWKEIFKNVKAEKRGDVHIYFCGSPGLAKVIKAECDNFGFLFSHSF